MNRPITQDRLKHLVDYNPDTGKFTCRTYRGGLKPGDQCGSLCGPGYLYAALDRQHYTMHRLAFMWMLGRWPTGQVDHINGVRSDNRWTNLREASWVQQRGNQCVRSDSKTGVKGVQRVGKRFGARIKHKHLGVFDTVREAQAAYMRAAGELFGEFARAA